MRQRHTSSYVHQSSRWDDKFLRSRAQYWNTGTTILTQWEQNIATLIIRYFPCRLGSNTVQREVNILSLRTTASSHWDYNTLTVPHVVSATYWQRINANGWAPNDLFSWKKTTVQWLHYVCYDSLLLRYLVIDTDNFITLSASDPPSSRPEWVLLYFSSCFPHLCWFPTDSFPRSSKAGRAPHPPCL
jgi:hypothetical protein